jgi:tetratricopeptide (TPR) repeat protein
MGMSQDWEARVDGLRGEVEAARAGGDARVLADALRRLANVERRPAWGREDARVHLEEAIALLRGLDEPLELSHAIRHLGIVHEDEKRLSEAEAAYDEALAIYRSAAERGGELDHANAVRYPAAIKWQLGKLDEAVPLWEEACERYERAGNAEGVVESAGRLALIARDAGDDEAASKWYGRSKDASARSDDPGTLKFVEEIEAGLAA